MSNPVALTSEEAMQLVLAEGYILAKPVVVRKGLKSITVLVAGNGGPLPVRITRNVDGSYRITFYGGASIDPKIARRAFLQKKLRRKQFEMLKARKSPPAAGSSNKPPQ